MRLLVACTLAAPLAAVLATAAAAPPLTTPPAAWLGCCGLSPWPEPGAMPRRGEGVGLLYRGFASLEGGSPLRHHLALTGEIPAAYARLHNPLPPTPENARRGAAVYEADCASCHGATGLADGPASRAHTPPPAHLGWIAKVPPRRRDAFMYWSIAEGGARFGSAMPAYKGKLSEDEIWSVIGYIQARLPTPRGASR